MSEALLQAVGSHTTKGALLQALANQNKGANDYGLLNLTGVVVQGQIITLGSDVYEINVVATDSTYNTANDELNDTGEGQRMIGVGTTVIPTLAVGDVLLVESEFLLVMGDIGTASCRVLRGFAGSAVAAHADAVDVYEALTPITAGRLHLPVTSTAAATADAQIAAAVNFWKTGYHPGAGNAALGKTVKAKLPVSAIALSSQVLFHTPPIGAPVETAENFTNGTLTDPFVSGQERAGVVAATFYHVVTADDVTAALIRKVVPFTAVGAIVSAFTATGAVLETAGAGFDGAVTITSAGGASIIDVDKGGSVDWVETSILKIEVF